MKKIVVDTDLLVGHVLHDDGKIPSDLRRLMGAYFCYTTVFHAIEAFSLCRTETERDAIEQSMHALKILGLNAKSGKNLGGLFSSFQDRNGLLLLAAGVCLESRLSLVSGRKKSYTGISGLTVLSPKEALAALAPEA